jgi:hypothetical protein
MMKNIDDDFALQRYIGIIPLQYTLLKTAKRAEGKVGPTFL